MKAMPFVSALALLCLTTGCATLNRSDRYTLEQHHVSQGLYLIMINREPLPVDGIIELSKRQLSSAFIINYLCSTATEYRLTPEDGARLREAKVSPEVIDYLYNTPHLYGRRYGYGLPLYPDFGYYPVYPTPMYPPIGVQAVIVTRPYGRRCR